MVNTLTSAPGRFLNGVSDAEEQVKQAVMRMLGIHPEQQPMQGQANPQMVQEANQSFVDAAKPKRKMPEK